MEKNIIKIRAFRVKEKQNDKEILVEKIYKNYYLPKPLNEFIKKLNGNKFYLYKSKVKDSIVAEDVAGNKITFSFQLMASLDLPKMAYIELGKPEDLVFKLNKKDTGIQTKLENVEAGDYVVLQSKIEPYGKTDEFDPVVHKDHFLITHIQPLLYIKNLKIKLSDLYEE